MEGWIKNRRDYDELSAAFERNQIRFAAGSLSKETAKWEYFLHYV